MNRRIQIFANVCHSVSKCSNYSSNQNIDKNDTKLQLDRVSYLI